MTERPAIKKFDLFKKNQWALNNVLKSNQEKARARNEAFEKVIMQQRSRISTLSVSINRLGTLIIGVLIMSAQKLLLQLSSDFKIRLCALTPDCNGPNESPV